MSLISVLLTRLNSLNTWDSPWLNVKFIAGLGTVLLVVSFGELGGFFRDTDLAYTGSAPLNIPPMWSEGGLPEYPLGTESNGKDMLAQLILGTSSSLKVGLLAASIGLLIGLILGAIAGYRGGWWDHIIRTISDAAMTIPSLVVLIVIASFIQMTDTTAMALILALFAWPGPTRMIRSQILSLRERGYVRMARLSGASAWEIMFVEMAPNMLPWLAASLTGGISAAILGATGLEALGLGPTRVPSLGLIINQATTNAALVRGMTWWWLPPILILMVIFAGFFLMTTGLDEIANPRLRRFKPTRRDPADRIDLARESLLKVEKPGIPLQIHNLHVHYATPMGDIAAASGVNLVLNKGEILGLVGESGCGKTTVASAILQVVQPPGRVVDGSVAVNGTDMMGLSEKALRQVRWRDLSLVPQG
ncbi:MAG: ABC transporter permease subunit, partial [Candidatus Latescibacteria bacterium]|nr:ABC transporter permease subunit [Candidatus Latescibacterota bacterium]